MVLAVLSGWLEKIDRVVSHDVDQERLLFMDGPFEVRVLKISPDLCELVLYKRDIEVILDSSVVSLHELLTVVLAAGARAALSCIERGMKSRDLDVLVNLIEKQRP